MVLRFSPHLKPVFSFVLTGRVSLDLLDLNGRQVLNLMDAEAPLGENTLDLSYARLRKGTCFLSLSHDSSGILTRKIVIAD